ncbi:maleylpyruvate isomerase family mycothiol-dependent enzyme [Candidatus Mycobacterium wuenschmannii]|uniref:Maleylpyruvate isomerase family mycothiol-dependent enzyme n=1 Tax=Candidatus Mycobacterium wuenschmannii TaxID=3027808 RepID=A0ABY8W4M8_9MYCO|nr:maleylpyruvate isomerase family mycothiol-dependent enzyme [Candidatus Mycobacterium wuenschmannii]WIM89378.1 maleylpyruvate isomerase family mycothiol-dependent enzyme [Candidatus Mycobacterium wuenschmannii]
MSTTRERLRDNDLRFLEVARALSDRDWSRQSLCAEWSNRDVLGHLIVGCQVSPGTLAADLIRHRGSFDRCNAALARGVAARRSPAALIDDFAALIEQPRGIGRVFPPRLLLGDHVIHELDILLPLGLEPTVGPEALTEVLETQVRVPNPFVPAAARARGLALHATDVDWRHGHGGPSVAGAAAHLASVLAGRPWALARLSGDGVAALRKRL